MTYNFSWTDFSEKADTQDFNSIYSINKINKKPIQRKNFHNLHRPTLQHRKKNIHIQR